MRKWSYSIGDEGTFHTVMALHTSYSVLSIQLITFLSFYLRVYVKKILYLYIINILYIDITSLSTFCRGASYLLNTEY